jgi:alcohol dehydrogenase class IV
VEVRWIRQRLSAFVITNGGKTEDYEGADSFKNDPMPLIAIPTSAGQQ